MPGEYQIELRAYDVNGNYGPATAASVTVPEPGAPETVPEGETEPDPDPPVETEPDPDPPVETEPEPYSVPDAPTGVEAVTDGSGSVTLSWERYAGDPDSDKEPASYEYALRRPGGPVEEWTTVPGSNADTTSVTIDLRPGQWIVYLRARNADGNAGGLFTTTVTVTAAGPAEPEAPEPAGPETVVPALPLAGLVTLALVLFLGGQRQRRG